MITLLITILNNTISLMPRTLLDWRRRLIWQLFCRFDVGRDLHFDDSRARVAWDATAPIPSEGGPLPVRRWPAVTLHDPELVQKIDSWLSKRL